MSRWSEDRWLRNDDGSYSRRIGGSSVADAGYEDMTKAELSDELEKRGLPKTGNKDDLVARLEDADADEES